MSVVLWLALALLAFLLLPLATLTFSSALTGGHLLPTDIFLLTLLLWCSMKSLSGVSDLACRSEKSVGVLSADDEAHEDTELSFCLAWAVRIRLE